MAGGQDGGRPRRRRADRRAACPRGAGVPAAGPGDVSVAALPELRTRGRWPPPEGPRAAIVGSRRPSPYGEAVAEQLALELARAGVIVISGLALGIDAAAHRGALVGGGVTVAVMGTGAPQLSGPELDDGGAVRRRRRGRGG